MCSEIKVSEFLQTNDRKLVAELFYTYGPFQRLFSSGTLPILSSMFLIVSQIRRTVPVSAQYNYLVAG